MTDSKQEELQMDKQSSMATIWTPIGALCCLLIVMFLIGTTIVLSLIPVYLPKRNSACHFNLRQKVVYSTMSAMYGGILGDFNQDNRLDIVIPEYDTQTVRVFLGNGDGMFPSQKTFFTGVNTNPYWVSSSDFNNDHRLDLAVAYFGTSVITIFLGNGDGTFTQKTTLSTGNSSEPVVLAIGDLNKDNIPDIVSDNIGSNDVGVFLGQGNGLFASQMVLDTGNGSQPYFVLIADLNQDTQLDILSVNTGNNNFGIFFGYGNGTFAPQVLTSTGTSSVPYAGVVGDFNQDNILDIAIANYGFGNIALYYGNGDGSFGSTRAFSTGNGSGPYLRITTDINKDGRLDIISANYGAGNVGVFIANGNGGFALQRTYSTGVGSQTSVIIAGDVNRDGRPDIIAAASGTQTITVFLGTC